MPRYLIIALTDRGDEVILESDGPPIDMDEFMEGWVEAEQLEMENDALFGESDEI